MSVMHVVDLLQKLAYIERVKWICLLVSAVMLAGCPGSNGSPDAPEADADLGPCDGDFRLFGEYLDVDSTNADFAGIATATVQPDGFPSFTTPPNGRIDKCLGTDDSYLVTMTGGASVNLQQNDAYLPTIVTAARHESHDALFTSRALSVNRLATFYTSDLGIGTPTVDGTVWIEVTDNSGSLFGEVTSVTGCGEGYVKNANGVYEKGNSPIVEPYVVFPNCTPAASMAVSIPSGESGYSCTGPMDLIGQANGVVDHRVIFGHFVCIPNI